MEEVENDGQRPRKMQKLEHPDTSTGGDDLPSHSSTRTDSRATNDHDSHLPAAVPPTMSPGQNAHASDSAPFREAEDYVIRSLAAAAAKAAAAGNANGSMLPTDELQPTLSKNAQKRLKRDQEWEAGRDFRRAKRKQKLAEKKERNRNARDEAAAAAATSTLGSGASSETTNEPGKPPKRSRIHLPVTIIIDCQFVEDYMLKPEIISLASQLTRSYSDNKNAPFGTHLRISSFNGELKDRFETVLNNHHKSWKHVHFTEEDYSIVADQAHAKMRGPDGGSLAGALSPKNGVEEDPSATVDGEVVYLTSESPNVLMELKPYSTYVVGGFVDRNRHKGLCYNKAMDRGVKTARLPIGEYMRMASRKVLTTNHVVEIMLRWLEFGDWGEAFSKVIPKRKGGVRKREADGMNGNEHVDEAEEDNAEEDDYEDDLADSGIDESSTEEEEPHGDIIPDRA
ncbi:MAG: tRNA (guanine(9)-N(1))-methyltransferase [Pycnora praestabilis]|nr:MAG: tRNA (guanine(9)-N(1))-methyltransferase [Pycnora praestabilis]